LSFKKNIILIILKSIILSALFFVPVYMFISKSFATNFASHIEYELKLQTAIHLNSTENTHILDNSKNLTLENNIEFSFNSKNLNFLRKYFTKDKFDDIIFESSLTGDFSKPIYIDNHWYITTFIYSNSQKNYHVSMAKSLKLDEMQENRNILFFILYIASFVLFTLFFMILKSQEKLWQQKRKISTALNESKFYFDKAMTGFIIVDKDRKILNVNPLLCKMFGYEKDELIGQSISIFHISQDSYERWSKKIYKKAQINSVVNIRYKMKRKDGMRFWIEISGTPFSQKKGIKDGSVVWTAYDVSDKVNNENTIKELNKTLSQNLNYLRTFLDTAPIPIFVKDKDSRYIECNNAFSKVIRKPKKDIINNKVDDLLPGFLALIHKRKDEELLYKNNIHYKEILSIDSTDSANTNIYEFHKTAIKEDGDYSGYVCVIVDVTRREEQEGELHRMVNIELEKNEALARSHEKERLKDAKFTAIGQLAAGITHEINTPLTYVKGNLEMLLMDLADLPDTYNQKQQILDDTKDMKDGLNRIATIVESMREMSQQKKVKVERTNIYATLITSLIMAHNRSKQICNLYINDELFVINAQKNQYEHFVNVQIQRIEQVWIVLLNNALDELQYIKTFEEREIRIKCFESDQNIIVEFSDNAGGINEDILENIFEPFVSSKLAGGMGVGLSVAKRIIDDQGAVVRAYNQNEGAIFEIVFDKAA